MKNKFYEMISWILLAVLWTILVIVDFYKGLSSIILIIMHILVVLLHWFVALQHIFRWKKRK